MLVTLALIVAGPLAVLSQPQAQPGQTTTTKSELSITALSPSGQATTVKFPGIPGLTKSGIPKCNAETGLDAQKTSANEVFCRTLRAELAKSGDAWKDVTKGGDIRIVGFASSESSTSTSISVPGNNGNAGGPGQNGGNGNSGGDGGVGGKTTNTPSSSATASKLFSVQSLAGAGLVVASGIFM